MGPPPGPGPPPGAGQVGEGDQLGDDFLWTGELHLPLPHLHGASLLPLRDEQVAVAPQGPRPRLLTDWAQHHAIVQGLAGQHVDAEVFDVGRGHHVGGGGEVEGGGGPVQFDPTAHLANRTLVGAQIRFDSIVFVSRPASTIIHCRCSAILALALQ